MGPHHHRRVFRALIGSDFRNQHAVHSLKTWEVTGSVLLELEPNYGPLV